jgi:hypothetical protein
MLPEVQSGSVTRVSYLVQMFRIRNHAMHTRPVMLKRGRVGRDASDSPTPRGTDTLPPMMRNYINCLFWDRGWRCCLVMSDDEMIYGGDLKATPASLSMHETQKNMIL